MRIRSTRRIAACEGKSGGSSEWRTGVRKSFRRVTSASRLAGGRHVMCAEPTPIFRPEQPYEREGTWATSRFPADLGGRGSAAGGTTAEAQRLRSLAGWFHQEEAIMGDRSPKAKQRDQKQKDAAKAEGAASAKAKQNNQSRAPLMMGKGKK